MSPKQALMELIDQLSEEEAARILVHVRELADQQEREEWLALSLANLVRARGSDEPGHGMDDAKPYPG